MTDYITNLLDNLDTIIYGNPLSHWLAALLIALASMLVLGRLFGFLLKTLANKERFRQVIIGEAIVGVLEEPSLIFIGAISLFLGVNFATLNADISYPVNRFLVLALIIQSGLWGAALVRHLLPRMFKHWNGNDQAAHSAQHLVRLFLLTAVWSVVLLLFLDNLGINVTALVTGLGIGGIAIALALQNILGDLFASLSIILDKPFEIGDFIAVGELKGNVERIGIKTTRLRSLTGEQLVFSNSDLLSSRIQNFKRMFERRVSFQIGVTYETPLEKLEEISALLKQIVESKEKVRFDRAHFQSLGDFALIFEIVYFVSSSEYNVYMDIQQSINIEIMQKLSAIGVEFAYPTQKLFLRSVND